VLVLSSACARAPEPIVKPVPAWEPQPAAPPVCARVVPKDPPLRIPYYADGKWGLADPDGVLVASPIYDEIKPTPFPRFMVRRDDAWGVIDSEGEVLIELAWARIGEQSAAHVAVVDGRGGVHLRDLCDRGALPEVYDNLEPGFPLHVAEHDGKWALLDQHGTPVSDWSNDRLRRGFFELILQQRDDGQLWVLHDDGRPWAPAIGNTLVNVPIWAEQALLTIDDLHEGRACLYDASGRPLVSCTAYRELWPLSDAPPLMWARNLAGWGLIELVEGSEPRVRIEHRYLAHEGNSLVDEVERIVVDADGQIVDRRPAAELEHGRLPEQCGRLVSWRRMQDPRDGEQSYLEYLDVEGEVVERSESGEGRERFQPVTRGELWGLRDACSRRFIVPSRYQRLQLCGETHVLADAGGSLDLYALGREQPFVAHLDAPTAKCEMGRIITDFGSTHGLLDLDGRELLPPRFHAIVMVHAALVQLQYFDLWVFASPDGTRYFDEPLPTPNEIPDPQ
jgi:hypothetical protein